MGHRIFVITEAVDCPLEYNDQGVRVFKVIPARLHLLDKRYIALKGFMERLEYSYAVSKKIREVVIKYKIDIIESCEARAEGLWYYLFEKRPPLVIKLHTPESIVFKLNASRALEDNLINKLEERHLRTRLEKIGFEIRAGDDKEKKLALAVEANKILSRLGEIQR